MARYSTKSTEDMEQAKDQSAVATADNLVTSADVLTVPAEDIVTVAGVDKAYAKMLEFNEENVEIIVNESSDPHAENPVIAGVNGQYVYFTRGEPTVCKRKFIEALASRNLNVKTTETKNNLGELGTGMSVTSALRYPFQLIRDDNPRGMDWLKQLVRRG